MLYEFHELKTDAVFNYHKENAELKSPSERNTSQKLFGIAWNKSVNQKLSIDGTIYTVPKNSLISVVNNNRYTFSNPGEIVLWEFNREFYCIIDHDKEVSCAGFLFYGAESPMLIQLDKQHTDKLERLQSTFEDEFEEADNIQGEMLRMLLKRLIILSTRLGKLQHLKNQSPPEQDYDLLRKFNFLVETNFTKYHQVQDYADLLNKSPKTLSNIFSKYSDKTALQIIRERITLEAKRLLLYTDKTMKEIAFELGFSDPVVFSKFFKKNTGTPPGSFKNQLQNKT